jgi:uncharacterized repeat protein (TIGR01451 family)
MKANRRLAKSISLIIVSAMLLGLVLSAATATTVYATAPYLIEPLWVPDPLDPGQPAPDPSAPHDADVAGRWWRDTTNQNAIAQQTYDQFTGTVYEPYGTNKLKMFVYSPLAGPTVIALVGTTSWLLVGTGGGKAEANAAKVGLQGYYPGLSSKKLLGIILTGASPEETWGTTYWRNTFRYTPPVPIYASAAFSAAAAERAAVDTAITAREDRAYGRINRVPNPATGGWKIDKMGWGPDRFLGAGSMMEYAPEIPSYTGPTNWVTEDTTLYIDGNLAVTLIPTTDRDAGLILWLPVQKILIGDAGRYLTDAGAIQQPSVSIPERIAELDRMIGLDPNIYAPVHTMYISGAAEVESALTTKRDALQSIYDQTLVRINAGDTIDEAAAAVALLADLAASPYNQELVSTIPGIVRNIYTEKLGWFGGETHELASTLTPAAKAAALADALGGSDALTAAARTAELNARDLAGAEKALYLAEAAYEAAPEDAAARQVYAQALRKNAFMQKSAQVRNYYLYVAFHMEQSVTDFAVLGDENTDLAFSAAEFSAHFIGISGATLDTVQILTLPPAEHGVLKCSWWPCHAGEALRVSEWVGLVFIPTSDWNGETSFTWNGASGGNNAAQPATVTITIAPLNDAPVVSSPLPDVTADEDALSATVDLSTAFTDAEGDPLSYTVQSSNPALVGATLDGATLTLDFQAEQNGAATITVSAADEAGEYGGVWATDDFVVTVNPVNDAPWATSQAESVTAGRARTFTLAYGDVETAKADLVVTFSGPSVGTLDTSALPSVTYTAPAGYIGPDSFTYTVTDRGDPDGCSAAPCSGALQAQATVSLDVAENSIKGRVYNDANANGSPDEGETGVAGVTVRLTPLDGSPAVELVTGEDGAYAFGSLLPGAYQVRQDLLPGYVQTTPDPADIDLALGQVAGGVDFGVVYSADLSVRMTADVNDRTIIYTFVVTNNGPAEALDAVLMNVRPHGVTYTSIITTQGACQGGITVTCEFGAVPASGSATVTIQANRTDKNNPIVNSATVAAATFDISLGNNSATVTVQ